jgi:hypothetical protein
MSLRLDLLSLILNMAFIIQYLSQNYIFFFNFTYSVRRFRVPQGVRTPQVEDHWYRAMRDKRFSLGVTATKDWEHVAFPGDIRLTTDSRKIWAQIAMQKTGALPSMDSDKQLCWMTKLM